jgi:triosephosphate isomerase
MPRTPFVAGNWKMNTTKSAAVALTKGVVDGVKDKSVRVGVAPPFVYLDAVGQAVRGSLVELGAQDVYFAKNGAFTGEISAEMLLDLGVSFCLAGHSERRHVLNEPGELVSKKAHAIYTAGMTVIHCVGETIDERQANLTLEVVRRQLNELTHAIDNPSRLVVAYEPVWAIGTGHTATSAQAQEVHAFIRSELAHIFNKDFSDRVVIQYGGSMKPENAKELIGQPDVDGGLIGGAALKADSFLGIVNAAK